MTDKDALDEIMGEFDDALGEDVDSTPTEEDDGSTLAEDNTGETQSERLERLHQEGELAKEEFRLLQTELIESNASSGQISPDDVPSVKTDNQFFSLKILGYEHTKSSKYDTKGILVAVEVTSKKEDMKIRPRQFTLHSSDGYTYSGVDLMDIIISESDGGEFARELVNSLPHKWPEPISAGFYEISAGGKIRGILYFPCDSETVIGKIRFTAEKLRHILSIPDEKIESSFGVAKHTSGNDELGAWDQYSLDISLSDAQREHYPGLPDKVKSELQVL